LSLLETITFFTLFMMCIVLNRVILIHFGETISDLHDAITVLVHKYVVKIFWNCHGRSESRHLTKYVLRHGRKDGDHEGFILQVPTKEGWIGHLSSSVVGAFHDCACGCDSSWSFHMAKSIKGSYFSRVECLWGSRL
jgi:hypothetical protein